MAKVNHIRANNKPDVLENDAIYFVKNGEIWMKYPDGGEVRFGKSIVQVQTFQQIQEGSPGIYHLDTPDHIDTDNPKRVGPYYKLSSGEIDILNPRTVRYTCNPGSVYNRALDYWILCNRYSATTCCYPETPVNVGDVLPTGGYYFQPKIMKQGFNWRVTNMLIRSGFHTLASTTVFHWGINIQKAKVYQPGIHLLLRKHIDYQTTREFFLETDDLDSSLVMSDEYVFTAFNIDTDGDTNARKLYLPFIQIIGKETIRL